MSEENEEIDWEQRWRKVNGELLDERKSLNAKIRSLRQKIADYEETIDALLVVVDGLRKHQFELLKGELTTETARARRWQMKYAAAEGEQA